MASLTLSFKGTVLKVYPVRSGDFVIGSDTGCDLRIDSLAVAPRHARIARTTTAFVLEAVDGDVTVNQATITEPSALQDDDVIGIGKHLLRFTHAPSDEAPTEPASVFKPAEKISAWLQIMNGQNVGKTISLNRALVNIGKSGVQAAVIARRNDGYFIAHLEGPHTALVDGAPLGERSVRLKDADIIQIGNVKMQFYLEQTP